MSNHDRVKKHFQSEGNKEQTLTELGLATRLTAIELRNLLAGKDFIQTGMDTYRMKVEALEQK